MYVLVLSTLVIYLLAAVFLDAALSVLQPTYLHGPQGRTWRLCIVALLSALRVIILSAAYLLMLRHPHAS